MSKRIDFYFDFASIYSYLASTQLEALASKAGAEIVYHPFGLLEVMALVGNRPTSLESRAKGAYIAIDQQRWARSYGVPLEYSPNVLATDWHLLQRGALAAIDRGHGRTYIHSLLSALWAGPADISHREALATFIDRIGVNGELILVKADTTEYVDKLWMANHEAAELGIFGAPTFIVGGKMFFGNDRLNWLAEELASHG